MLSEKMGQMAGHLVSLLRIFTILVKIFPRKNTQVVGANEFKISDFKEIKMYSHFIFRLIPEVN